MLGERVRRWRLGAGCGGFVLGGLFGGLVHLLLLFGRTDAVLRRGGHDPVYWWLKSPGETMAALLFWYSLPCGVILAIAVIYFGLGGIVEAVLRRYAERLQASGRRDWARILMGLAGALLGAICAAALNLRAIGDDFAKYGMGDPFYRAVNVEVVTAIRALTGIYSGILLAGFAGVVLIQAVRLTRRRV